MGIKGLAKGGINLIKSNKFAGRVIKTTKELLTPNGGVDSLVTGAMENQAKRMVRRANTSGMNEEASRQMKYMASMLMNGASGGKIEIKRGANFKGGKAKQYVHRPSGMPTANSSQQYLNDIAKFYGVSGNNKDEYMRNLIDATQSSNQNYRMFGNRFDNVNRKDLLSRPTSFKDYSDYNTLYTATVGGARSIDEVNGAHRVMGNIVSAQGVARQYLWDGATKGQRAARIGAVTAGYVGINAAGRALTGGDLRHNRKGEDDIAGIPFI